MTPALNHAQGWRPARAGEPVRLRHGKPASVAARDNHQFHGSSRPSARCEKPRATCRGHRRAPVFSSGWITSPNELAELRTRVLAGLQALHVAAMLDTLGNQPPTQIADASTHFVERLSSRVSLATIHSERASQGRGDFTQARGPITQEANCV